jgi:molybdenum cofactor cytidylyltransferase
VIAAIVLAAGRSTRMGTAKMLLRLGGRTVLRRVVDHARASQCAPVLVVVGAEAAAVAAEAAGVRIVWNPRYAEGLATSLAAGVAALPGDCEAAVVLLGDQPGVTAPAIDALIAAFRRTGKPLVASRYGTATGAPMLIAAPMFSEAQSLQGDAAGRLLIARHPDLVEGVPLPASAAADLDTPQDLARLRAEFPEEDAPPR